MNKNAPPSSHVAQALYERNFELAALKNIFVSTVNEDETDRFIRSQLYREAGLYWDAHESPPDEPQVWTYDTREFDGLLGVRIGKVVAYIVLGAFPQGTRRIRRVIT